MNTFKMDAYKGFTPEQLRERCLKLVRDNIRKDMLICGLVQHGGVDAMPKYFGDQVREIVAAYCDDDANTTQTPAGDGEYGLSPNEKGQPR